MNLVLDSDMNVSNRYNCLRYISLHGDLKVKHMIPKRKEEALVPSLSVKSLYKGFPYGPAP